MKRKLPQEAAFAFYLSLGKDRSYERVAEEFGVSKGAVTNLATAEKWQERHQRIERKVRERTEAAAVETLGAMNERHLKTLRFVQGRAIEALRSLPIESALGAIRALDLAIARERTIRGQPSEQALLSGVLVAPAEMTPDQWIKSEMKRAAEQSADVTQNGNGRVADGARTATNS